MEIFNYSHDSRIPAYLRAYIALGILSLLWGYNWVVVKEAIRYCPPFTFSALRVTFGAVLLILVLARKGGNLLPRNYPFLILLGLFSTTGGIGLSTWALEYGGAGKTAILVYTMPFWVLMIAWPVLSERIRGMQWLAVGLALSGLALILEPWRGFTSSFGSLLAVLGGIAWGGGAVLIRMLRRRGEFDLVFVSAWQMLFGAVPIVIAAFIVEVQPVQWTPYLVGALFYNIVFATALATLLWFYSLYELPAGMASMGTLITPVIGVVSASVQLGESPGLPETSGIILILSGLAIIALRDLKK